MFRQVSANNKYMQTYDRSRIITHFMYFDVNNLYGWAMYRSLLYANFRWDIENFNIMNVALDSPTGYILEVDLEY